MRPPPPPLSPSTPVCATRRALLLGCAAWATTAAARPTLQTRQLGQALLVESTRARILIDPDGSEEVGPIDLLCLCQGQTRGLRRLNLEHTRVLVPDETAARHARALGPRAVRVAEPYDVVAWRDVVVTASPARAALGAAVGFHVRLGRSGVWHTGPIAPLDVDSAPAAFAKDHPAIVIVGNTSAEDLATLAALAVPR